MQEKDNVLDILERTKEAIKKGDVVLLKELSNRTTHTASISQDPDNIAIAVIVYSLSKILEREQYKMYKGWNNFYKFYIDSIDNIIVAIKKNDDIRLKQSLEAIRNSIKKLSGDLKRDIQDVFRKASINKASKIYEHGISMEKTASLLGVTMFELASYAGQKEITESNLTRTVNVKDRIKLTMEMFA